MEYTAVEGTVDGDEVARAPAQVNSPTILLNEESAGGDNVVDARNVYDTGRRLNADKRQSEREKRRADSPTIDSSVESGEVSAQIFKDDRNAEIHNMLRDNNTYDGLQASYKDERAGIPVVKKGLSRISKALLGVSSRTVKLDRMIALAVQAGQTAYRPEYEAVVQEAAQHFIAESEKTVEKAYERLERVSAKRGELANQIASTEIGLRTKASEKSAYERRIAQYRNDIDDAVRDLTNIQAGGEVKGGSPEEVAKALKSNIRAAEDNRNECNEKSRKLYNEMEQDEIDLGDYQAAHVDTQAVEGQFRSVYASAHQNLVRLRRFLVTKDETVSSVELLKLMESMNTMNIAIGGTLTQLDAIFDDKMGEIAAKMPGAQDGSIAATNYRQELANDAKTREQALTEKHLPPEPA